MDINNDVYQVLYKIGLNEENVKDIFNENKNLTRVLDIDVVQVINFLKKYKLTAHEIAAISKQNPWILTESFERMRLLEELYKSVGITNFAELLKKQPIAMSINPKDLKNLINKFLEEQKSKEEITLIILENLDEYVRL